MRLLTLGLATATLGLAACASPGDPPGTSELPAEVVAFVKQRDGCDHFRGEEPYDAERARFINERLEALCTGTDRRLAELRARYRTRADVTAALAGYEDAVE